MKIAVVGPQNTGKSTFIKDFLKEFNHYISPPETYRDRIEKTNLKVNQQTSEASQKEIMNFMIQNINSYINLDDVIFDRCLIDNYVYTKCAYDKGKISEEFLFENWKAVLKDIKNYDYVFLIPTQISVSLVDDGTRDIDIKFIDKVNREFMIILFDLVRNYKLNVKIISGNRKERIALARNILMSK